MTYKTLMPILFVFIVILIIIVFNKSKMSEGYDNYHLENAMGSVPSSQTNVLVQDTYPITGINGISNNGASDIWWHFPNFKLGSYDQITNNLRYPNNPDEGTCMPASMCGALYREKHIKSNYISELPPISPECGTRIGYFTTNKNMLPFRTNIPNVLY